MGLNGMGWILLLASQGSYSCMLSSEIPAGSWGQKEYVAAGGEGFGNAAGEHHFL